MTFQKNVSVTKNKKRKLEKKVRNSKNPQEKEHWEQELLEYQKREHLKQLKKKKKLAAQRKISDEEAFQQAKKYNASQVAQKIAHEKDQQKQKMEQVRVLHQEALEGKKFKDDVKEDFFAYKVEHPEEINERIKKLTDNEDNPMSEKKAIQTINREIMKECYEKRMKAQKIKVIAEKENVSLEKSEEILDDITEKIKLFIQQSIEDKKD